MGFLAQKLFLKQNPLKCAGRRNNVTSGQLSGVFFDHQRTCFRRKTSGLLIFIEHTQCPEVGFRPAGCNIVKGFVRDIGVPKFNGSALFVGVQDDRYDRGFFLPIEVPLLYDLFVFDEFEVFAGDAVIPQ